MPTTDSNGIIRYLDTDGAPTPPVLNLGMQSVSDAISPYINRLLWAAADGASSASLYTEDEQGGARLRLNSNGGLRVTRAGDSLQRTLPFAVHTREYSASFTTRSFYTISFNFPDNLFTQAPIVTTNIASGNGSAVGWISRATQITATGFTFYLAKLTAGENAWSNIPIQFTAIQANP